MEAAWRFIAEDDASAAGITTTPVPSTKPGQYALPVVLAYYIVRQTGKMART